MSTDQFVPGDDGVTEEGALVNITSASALEAQTRGEIDIQINTAKRFPRDIGRCLKNAVALATMSEETAKECMYSLPRGKDQVIEGKSVRLAEIAMNCWGNIRAQSIVVGMDAEFVTVEGRCHDLETNTAIAQQVRRRIVDKNGKRYSTDVLTSTTNAASSIALRNAIFRVIPGAFSDTIYAHARKCAIGSAETFPAKRDKAIAVFLKMGVREDQILAAVGVATRQGITGDEYLKMEGFLNAIRQDGVSIESIFAPPEKPVADASKGTQGQKEELKSRVKANGHAATAPVVDDVAAKAEAEEQRRAAPVAVQSGAQAPDGLDLDVPAEPSNLRAFTD